MRRRFNIKYELKQELGKMSAIGQSKHDLKVQTFKEREIYKNKLINNGYSRNEAYQLAIKEINYLRDKIFSHNTMKTYQTIVSCFADYIISEAGTKKVSIEQAQEYIQPFLDHEKNINLSANTLHTIRAAICKPLKCPVSDLKVPERHYTNSLSKTLKTAQNEAYNANKAKWALELNSAVGLRRNELKNLSLSQITETERGLEIKTIGKGGKHNLTLIIIPEKIEMIKKYMTEAICSNRNTLLTPSDMANDADLHQQRSLCAQEHYKAVLSDLEANTEKRNFYISEIENRFAEMNKTPHEKLEGIYETRGYNKKVLSNLGKPTKFDRTALMHTSIFVLNHWRSDVTVQHYLVK